MKLSVKGFTITCGVIWGAALFMAGLGNLIWPTYGGAFLEAIDSIYPGYHAGTGFGSVIVVSLYGVLDAAIGGAVFAWLYNRFAN